MTAVDEQSMMNHNSVRVVPSRAMRPFDHQVAGQSVMLHYNETTICKCLLQREYQFYQVMPKCLLPFVPEFRGVIQLYVTESESQDCPIGCSCSRCQGDGVHLDWSQNGCPSTEERVEGLSLDASRLRVLQKTTRNTGPDIQENMYYFMLLEDLMSRYRNPCVLDLKMGVRQHGDDAPPDKVAYQTKKCQSTTSSSLGLRLCGMKRYDAVSDEFETRERMYGRQLNDEEFKSQIVKFLYNGHEIRTDLISSILQQLQNLKNVVEQLDGYRFYSSSLLIIYEGTVAQEEQISEELHFECDNHSEHVSDSQLEQNGSIYNNNDNKTPDNIVSKDSIKKVVVVGDEDSQHVCSTDSPECSNEQRQPNCSGKNVCRYHFDNTSSEIEEEVLASTSSGSIQKHLESSVDIKVVDFAHATFDGFLDCTVKHCGPDHGFLLGVNTLLEIFMELKDRCTF